MKFTQESWGIPTGFLWQLWMYQLNSRLPPAPKSPPSSRHSAPGSPFCSNPQRPLPGKEAKDGNQLGCRSSKPHSWGWTFQMVTSIVWWSQPGKPKFSVNASRDYEAKLNSERNQMKKPNSKICGNARMLDSWLLTPAWQALVGLCVASIKDRSLRPPAS